MSIVYNQTVNVKDCFVSLSYPIVQETFYKVCKLVIGFFSWYPPLTSIFLFTILLNSTGCVAIVAGGGAGSGTAYALGDLNVTLEATPAKRRSAIQRGAADIGLKQISGSGDELEGKYVFRTGADRKVTVAYEASTSQAMQLSIRVGTFGDEDLSQKIYSAIKKRL